MGGEEVHLMGFEKGLERVGWNESSKGGQSLLLRHL